MATDIGIDNLRPYIRNASPDGLFLEFGVAQGHTIKRLAPFVPGIIYGFDSFDGLPEDWMGGRNIIMPKGSFRCAEPTDLPPNVRIVKGLFQHTLPEFLYNHKEPVSFAHIDCDLYSSTIFVLNELRHRLHGAILAFDEIAAYPEFEENEGAALRDFLDASGYTAEFLERQWSGGGVYRMTAPC